MSVKDDTCADFAAELYGDEDEQQPVSEDEVITVEDNEDENKELGMPARLQFERDDSDRSRSPFIKEEPVDPQEYLDIVIREDDVEQDSFLTADSHDLYESTESMECDSGDEDVRGGVRGGKRGRLCGRGRASHGGKSVRSRRIVGRQWEIGYPLEEIWVSDADVPSELRQLARDVVRRRKTTRERENKACESKDEDDFQDATDEKSNSVQEGESSFEWSPMNTFRSGEELFSPEYTGPVQQYWTPYDAFKSFWDDDIIQHIVDETNRYATTIPLSTFQSEWYPTNSHEILCLFAFWIMFDIIRMPTLKSCFSTEPLLKTKVFRLIFTYKRLNILMRALHFLDTDTSSSDRLSGLRPVITYLNTKFQENYVPSKDICIDESLSLWKERLDGKQYIRLKAPKFWIKSLEICESATGYLWSFIVYTEKPNELQQKSIAKGIAVVKKLIHPLLNKGYRLFMDNWYSSPRLARFFKRNGTDFVGTLRSSCPDVPYFLYHTPLRQGQLVARHSGDVSVLSWQDYTRINMISTCHGTATGLSRIPSKTPIRPLPFRPQVVLDYNKSIGGIDLRDQMREPYYEELKLCTKWFMKLFKRLLNCSVLNSRILMQSSMQCPQDHLAFRLKLVGSILTYHLSHCPQSRNPIVISSGSENAARIVQHSHWPVRVQQTASFSEKNRKARKQCVVCLREGRRTIRSCYRCESCDVALCVENCFKKYHTTYIDSSV